MTALILLVDIFRSSSSLGDQRGAGLVLFSQSRSVLPVLKQRISREAKELDSLLLHSQGDR